MAGNISNSNIWDPADTAKQAEVRGMFEEMVGWAVEEGADIIIGETFYYAGEALAALEIAKASGLPVVLTLAPMAFQEMADGVGIVETAQQLEQAGADAVGLNCFRGPETMLPWLERIREAVSCHVGALPIPYRTTAEEPTFFNLSDVTASVPSPHGRTFPTALDPLLANRYEIRAFAEEAYALGVNYLGVCCGAAPIHIREVAEAVGRTPEASRFSENMAEPFHVRHQRALARAHRGTRLPRLKTRVGRSAPGRRSRNRRPLRPDVGPAGWPSPVPSMTPSGRSRA